MKKNIVLTFVIILASNVSFSQSRDFQTQKIIQTQNQLDRDGRDNKDKKLNYIDGNHYFDVNPFKLNIPGSQNELAKYNAFTDKIEILTGGTDVMILTPEKGVILSSLDTKKNYIFTDYLNRKNEPVVGYLDIISKNERISLFKKQQIVLIPAVEAKNSYDTPKPAHYKKLEAEYFIQLKENAAIVPFPKKKKEIERIIAGKDKEIETFTKENKISLSDEKDLIRLCAFLNTLL
jgi:hypothetical protein